MLLIVIPSKASGHKIHSFIIDIKLNKKMRKCEFLSVSSF